MMRDSNPNVMPVESEDFKMEVKLGQYKLAECQLSQLSDFKKLSMN